MNLATADKKKAPEQVLAVLDSGLAELEESLEHLRQEVESLRRNPPQGFRTEK